MNGVLGDDFAYEYVEIYAQSGNNSKALRWLESAMRLRDGSLVNTMKKRSAIALAGAFSLVSLFGNPTQATDASVRHSLESDYGFMIGRWTCHVTQAGMPDRDVAVEYEWAYDRRVLRETMRLKDKLIGEFLTTYDKATDRFKGVGVGAWGGYVVWENRGFHEGHLSETGYMFDSGGMTPVSRSEFERVSDTHYVVHDFDLGPGSAKGSATDTEDCIKAK